MKVSVAILSAVMLATPVLARGRGGNGKGKSAVEEEPTCECVAPFTITLTEYVDTVGNAQPITSIEEAIMATPEQCILITPSVDDLTVFPPPNGNPLAAVLPAPSNPYLTCTPNDSGALPSGCTLGWIYLDGTDVPSDIGAPPATWASADQGERAVIVDAAGQLSTCGGCAGAPQTAYYSCCYTTQDTCLDFSMPATMVPTPSPTKGMNGRGNGGRRLY